MRKILLATIAVAGLATATFATSAFAAAPDLAALERMQQSHAVMLDAHLAGMKAGLKLTAEQEKNWPAFEAAIRDAEKARTDRWRQARDRMGQGERPSPIERMTIMSEHLQKMAAQLQVVADASKPLYDSLTDAQKSDFDLLIRGFRPLGSHGSGRMRSHGEGGGPM